MLTSTLIAPNALKMLLPSRGQVTIQSESNIPTVTIHSGSRITVDGRTVSLEELGMVLDARLQGIPEPTIKVVTSPSVSVGDAVQDHECGSRKELYRCFKTVIMAIESRNKTNKNFSMSGMSDIVFLLLIFFMITSTLIVPAAQNVELPESNNQTQANPVLVVSIAHR